MSNVTQLPTSAQSYITVRKQGAFWVVQLVQPAPMGDLRTTLYGMSDKAYAHTAARKTAAEMLRPFKLRGVIQ